MFLNESDAVGGHFESVVLKRSEESLLPLASDVFFRDRGNAQPPPVHRDHGDPQLQLRHLGPAARSGTSGGRSRVYCSTGFRLGEAGAADREWEATTGLSVWGGKSRRSLSSKILAITTLRWSRLSGERPGSTGPALTRPVTIEEEGFGEVFTI